jgi:hypothetical protein
MRLDLRGIMNEAGTVPFDFETDLSGMSFYSIARFLRLCAPPEG